MRASIFFPLIGIIVIFACSDAHHPVATREVQVKAPFPMPAIKIPDFTGCTRFSITDFGADSLSQGKTSRAIAQAIDAAHKANGGVVVIPKGTWPTGQVHLKSKVNLHLDEGATLEFSGNPEDYLPPVATSWEGMECMNYSPLIYAYGCENIAITGPGTLMARMEVWRTWFSRPPAHMNALKRLYTMAAKDVPVKERVMLDDSSHLRPHFIQFNRCRQVLMDSVRIENSPFWTIHPYHSNDVVIRNVQVKAHGHNNDGVDPEMVQNVLIESCIFDQGDDAIAVKAGRNQDAWRLDRPTRNLVIRNILVRNGHQLLAIGSELSGGIENVYLANSRVEPGAKLNHLVYIKTNERRGGFVRQIFADGIQAGAIDKGILGIETDVLYQWRDLVPTYERRLTPISGIHLSDIHASEAEFVSRIQGQPEIPVTEVTLQNVQVDSLRGPEAIVQEYVEGLRIE